MLLNNITNKLNFDKSEFAIDFRLTKSDYPEFCVIQNQPPMEKYETSNSVLCSTKT